MSDLERTMTYRAIPVGELPPPHGMFRCRYAGRFKELSEDAKSMEDFQVVGRLFMAELASYDLSRCKYHRTRCHSVDWRTIADCADRIIAILGPRPRQEDWSGLVERAPVKRRDRGWLDSLFSDPIGIGSQGTGFVNGQHRACAIRMSGAPRVVVAD